MWTLITVTGDGEVHHSRNFPTRELCEQAKSLALTGKTIEQIKAEDEEAERWRKQRAEEWRKAHPPREPSTRAERKMVEDSKGGMCGISGSTGPYTNVGTDGLLYDWPGSDWGGVTYSPNEGEFVGLRGEVRNRHQVRHAECVLTNPEFLSEPKAA